MIERTLHRLQNTRDLRAEAISLAAELAGNDESAKLIVASPAINPETARAEWTRLLPAIVETIAARMTLEIRTQPIETGKRHGELSATAWSIPLQRPNYRYEVLRQLLTASLRGEEPPTIRALIGTIGASQTPIRLALAELKSAGLVGTSKYGLVLNPAEISQEVLARLRALPQRLRLRFARGAQDKSPAVLLQRLQLLSSGELPCGWSSLSISGVPVAQRDVPQIDVVGIPRLDFVAQVPRSAKNFDVRVLRQLDIGLEVEPNVLAPAPVVVTIVRAAIVAPRIVATGHLLYAEECDVFLSLLDLGLRAQAIEYAKAQRS